MLAPLGQWCSTVIDKRRAVFETPAKTSFLFDLDGTLVWSTASISPCWPGGRRFRRRESNLSIWRIHRKIGMSGGLFTSMRLRETGYQIDPERIERLRHLHAAAFKRNSANIQLLPGARELLAYLTHAEIPWAIATSGRIETARQLLQAAASATLGLAARAPATETPSVSSSATPEVTQAPG